MISKNLAICNHCDRYNQGMCSAFPEGIPMIFLTGDAEHVKIFPGQVGTDVFLQKKTKRKKL